jgi:hypothetical protein
MMRKIVLSLAAAGAALVVASPAAAQYYPAAQPAPYGYHNGYRGGFGQVRAFQMRIDNIERQIDRLDRRDRVGDHAADRLRAEADRVRDRLRDIGRGGLNPREAGEMETRIQRLEQRVRFAMNDRRFGDRDDRGRGHDRD